MTGNRSPEKSTYEAIRVVLCRTSHPGNIGAAARAMKTMGLSRLYLVEPQVFPSDEAVRRASGAVDILEQAKICTSLSDALGDVHLACALTSRKRELSLPMRSAREAAQELAQASQNYEVALVFGNETYGLSNEELSHCQMPVMIPANPDYASLNLGSAVQVMAYEMRMALLDPAATSIENRQIGEWASGEEIEHLFAHFERAMISTEFLDPAKPRRLMPRIRRLFGRTRLEKEEINILRGMLSAFEKSSS